MTDEEVSVVDKWYGGRKTTYPIAILDGELEKLLGVPHFPFTGVISPEGEIIYAGNSPESTLKKAMKSARAGSMWPKKLAKAAGLLRNNKLGDGWTELQAVKTTGGLDERESATLGKFEKHVTETSAGAVKAARDLFKKDLVYAALQKVQDIADAKPPLPASEDAAKLVAELKALSTFDLEVKGGEAYEAGRAKEDESDFLGAVTAYRDAAKKGEGAKIAAVALARAKDLVDRNLPGYSPVCPKCNATKVKKACDKHHKPVKL